MGVRGGVESVAHLLRGHVHTPNTALLSTDISNAFNTIQRDKVLTQLFKTPKLESLFRLAHWSYSQPSPLYFKNTDGTIHTTLNSSTGVRQGCPLGSLLFALTIHPHIIEATKGTSVRALGILDDVCFIGKPQAELIDTVAKYSDSVAKIGLKLNPSKQRFICFSDISENTRTLLANRNTEICTTTAEIVGTVLAKHPSSLKSFVQEKIADLTTSLKLLQHAKMPAQHAILLLRQSIVNKL